MSDHLDGPVPDDDYFAGDVATDQADDLSPPVDSIEVGDVTVLVVRDPRMPRRWGFLIPGPDPDLVPLDVLEAADRPTEET